MQHCYLNVVYMPAQKDNSVNEKCAQTIGFTCVMFRQVQLLNTRKTVSKQLNII